MASSFFSHLSKIYFITFIIFFILLAWFIQNSLFLNWDIAYILQATEKLLQGGTYLDDYFNPNPPMIMFFYLPSLMIHKFLHIHIAKAFFAYIFLISAFSFWLCISITRSMFSKDDSFLHYFFLIALAIVFLIFPLFQIGQRDQLLVVLSMPYLLSAAYQLQKDSKQSPHAVLIGLLAGVGFSLKPQFLFTPILIELFYIIYKKNWLSWLRTETLTILTVLCIYLGVLFIFYREFVFTIIPYLLNHYYESIGYPWRHLFLNSETLFCFLSFLFCGIAFIHSSYKTLLSILSITLISFLFSYFTQRSTFAYHIIPAYSIAILIFSLVFCEFITKSKIKNVDYLLLILPSIPLSIFLFHFMRGAWVTILFSPILFFSFFAILFFILLTANAVKKNFFITIFLVSCIILIAALFSHVTIKNGEPHAFLFTLLFLILLFTLFVAKNHKGLFNNLFCVLLGMMIFAFPVYNRYLIYLQGVSYKETILNKLITFKDSNAPQQSIYVFSRLGNIGSPLFYYTHSTLAQRFDCLWMVSGFVKQLKFDDNSLRNYIRSNKDSHFFLNMITDDLKNKKPELVFVDITKSNILIDGQFSHFDYLNHFLENAEFRKEWLRYRYKATLEVGRTKFEVFTRAEITNNYE